MPDIDWSVVNTALIIAAIGYLVRQSRKVDGVRQSLLGFEGQGGIIAEVKLLRERSHELAGAMTALSGSVHLLAMDLHALKDRKPGEERRRS